ncbi:MAG: staygreen family protein [Atribacterota bacterium]
MGRLRTEKLHVRFIGVTEREPVLPRRYTLTHSDATGDLFLTIGKEYNHKALSSLKSKFMRDEVLGEWLQDLEGLALHLYCHVGGGLVFGSLALRDAIFRRELPLVLETIRFGDRLFFEEHSDLDHAPILVHFQAPHPKYRRVELWGTPQAYRWD